MKNEIGIEEFMGLSNKEKALYFVRDEEGNFFDIEVPDFSTRKWDCFCEFCEKKLDGISGLGTTDTREPYFHFECFAELNKNCRFVLDWKEKGLVA